MEKVGNDPENSSDFRKIFSRVPEGVRVYIKMDIEGGEYRVLSGLKEYYGRITGLVIEFHFMIFMYDVIYNRISELKRYFNIVHIHANNLGGIDRRGMPMTIEVTFENKRLFSGRNMESEREYPVESLDYANYIGFRDYKLEFGDSTFQAVFNISG